MSNRKMVILGFVLVVLAQLYVPAIMIMDRENILKTGKEFRFKTAPVDPNDPFRGKFVYLQYEADTVQVDYNKEWKINEEIFISLDIDKQGFVYITSASKEEPSSDEDFLKVKVRNIPDNSNKILTIEYPFDRFYLEESKASNAEQQYIKAQQDTTNLTYALVNIKNGNAVLKDVLINGVSISKIAENKRE